MSGMSDMSASPPEIEPAEQMKDGLRAGDADGDLEVVELRSEHPARNPAAQEHEDERDEERAAEPRADGLADLLGGLH
jgi:hypothetical protein